MSRLGRACLAVTSLAVTGLALLLGRNGPYTVEYRLQRPIAEVWDAITVKRIVDSYYLAPLGMDMPDAGGEVYYGTAAQKLITGRVLEKAAPRRLVHTFRFAGDGEIESTVTYELAQVEGATRLRLEHRGYRAGSPRHTDIAMGWPIILDRLLQRLEATR